MHIERTSSRHWCLISAAAFFASAALLCGEVRPETMAPGTRIQIQLANGDRVSGELIWRADGKIRVRSTFLGDFTISEADAAVLEIPSSVSETNETNPSPPAPPVESVKFAATPTRPAARPRIATDAPNHAIKPEAETWKGKIELGYAQQSGRTDTLSYNARAEAEKKSRRNTLRANGRILYAKQNDRPSADRGDASVRWRYQLTNRSFAQAQTIYYTDAITQIQNNFEQNAGLGYRIVDGRRHTANVGAGITGQYRDWEAGTNGFAPYGEIFQDYLFKINDRITLNQDLVAQYSPSDRAFNIPSKGTPATVDPDQQNYKLRFNSTLQGKVTERVSVNLRYEFELDNAIKVENARETQRITSSIGYAF